MACITERTYIDGEWEITEKVTKVNSKQISEYGGPTADTGWLYGNSGNIKYRTYVAGESAAGESCCLEERSSSSSSSSSSST